MRSAASRRTSIASFSAAVVALAACGMSGVSDAAEASSVTRDATVKVIRTIPHDPTSYTQGLEVKGDLLYESVGLFGSSGLKLSNLKTGKLINFIMIDPKQFAEGLTIGPDGKVVQLTWTDKLAYVRHPRTLVEEKRFSYTEEGWGICYSSKKKVFVHTDGSSLLRLRNTKDFSIASTLTTKFSDGSQPTKLNELECVDNTVYVNVWQTKQILQIDLNNGSVLRRIDASALGPATPASPDDVLNGIAKLPNGNFLLTGKRWPTSYEVQFVNQPK